MLDTSKFSPAATCLRTVANVPSHLHRNALDEIAQPEQHNRPLKSVRPTEPIHLALESSRRSCATTFRGAHRATTAADSASSAPTGLAYGAQHQSATQASKENFNENTA